MANLKVGDLVRLRSGGPVMTVEETEGAPLQAGQIRCQWFAGKRLEREIFPQENLIDAKDDPSVPGNGPGAGMSTEKIIREIVAKRAGQDAQQPGEK
jgi:uncharacterized protein YodC (DUF2158 family)